jgi:hypothetical protein
MPLPRSSKLAACSEQGSNEDEVEIIVAFFKAINTKKSSNLKSLFGKFDLKQVNCIVEGLVSDVFDFEKLKRSILPGPILTLAQRLDRNENLKGFYESLKHLFQNGIISNINFVVEIFMLKIQFIHKDLVDYFKSHTQISKVNPNDNETDLINFYLGHKVSFAFARLAKLNTPSIKIDMTREISDANSFLIDGLSLVAECFLCQNVDWSLGGQYLHFIYTFERYIEMFSSLTDFYYIVFFRDMDKSLGFERCIVLFSFEHCLQSLVKYGKQIEN